jgi:phage terminase large subunit-like protein
MELVKEYINRVVEGREVICQNARAAVLRHLSDLEKQAREDYPFYFDEAAATRVIEFVKICRHTKGQWMGKKFLLQPWQAFIIACVFGWKKKKMVSGVLIALIYVSPGRMVKRN